MFPLWKGQMDDLSICLLLCKLTSRDKNTGWKNHNNAGKPYNFTFDQLTKNPQIFIDSYPDPFCKIFYKNIRPHYCERN